MTYLVFDLETETHKSYKRTANPFDERNYVVARGWKIAGDQQCSWEYFPSHNRKSYLRIPSTVKLLVGWNIKFDILYEMVQENPELHAFFKRGGMIWDGQYAEYLIEAQRQEFQYAALGDTAPRYGGTKKIDAVKAMWEEGYLTSQIPEDLLIDYLVGTEEEGRNGGDIRNTELCFLGQVKRATELGMTKMIQDRMDGLLATTDMEFRGLKINVQEAGKRLGELNAELATVSAELNQYVPADVPFEFNWGSGNHSSCIIFGGTVKYQKQAPYKDEATGDWAKKKEKQTHFILNDGTTTALAPADGDVPVSMYKFNLSGKNKGQPKTKQVDVPGEIKTKYQDFFYSFPGHTLPDEEWATKKADGYGAPIYSTSSDIITELGLRNIPFTKALSTKARLDKEIGTYYCKYDEKKKEWSGMMTCIQKHDHILHHRLNHTATITSRLSSSDPNLQNLPRGDKSQVKKMFVSRFGKDGKMIEADYSQLEVVVQGVLSGDPELCRMLRAKVDFHCIRVAAKFKNTRPEVTYEYALDWCKNELHPDYKAGKKERTKCKIFSFQRAYGAGAATIAAETGMSLEETQELIKAEDDLFPGVVEFNAHVEGAVLKSAQPFQSVGDDGQWRTYRRGYWQSFTGTRYSWRTYDAPAYAQKRGIKDSFNPPEMKNYPTQGTGGEFVQAVALGKLWRRFIETDYYGGKAYMVNTVHDCVWSDTHSDVTDIVAEDMHRIMESIPEFYNTRHNANITVPFPVEVEVGANMYELSHWKAH